MNNSPRSGGSAGQAPLPSKIGKYKILERIGRGAMGVVYSARDEIMDRVVALKVMAGDLEAEPETRARFYREAKVGGQLLHRNITTVFDLGESEGRLYMVMELLRGQPLNQFLSRPEGVTLESKLDLMIQLCEGLAAAHAHGVFHRDIKPSNLYVLDDGTLKILDFGIARLATSTMTATGSIVGTPDYMSPEQTIGRDVDQRSDIFSAGALFYAMLTGSKPFSSPDLPTVLRKVQKEDPPPITSPDVPAGLSRIIMKALAKKKEDRHQTARELASSLVQFRREWEAEARSIAERAHGVYKTIESLLEEQVHIAERLGTEKPQVPDPVLAAIHEEYPVVADRGPDVLLRIPFKREVITTIAARLDERRRELEAAVERLHAASLAAAPAGEMPPSAKVFHAPIGAPGMSERSTVVVPASKAAPRVAASAAFEIEQAQARFDAGERREAIAGLRALLSAGPGIPEVKAAIIRLSAEADRLAEIERRQRQVAAHVEAAEAAWTRGDAERARDEASAALAIDTSADRAADLLMDATARLRRTALDAARLADANAALSEARELIGKSDWARAASRASSAALVPETAAAGKALLLEVLRHESEERIENLRARVDRDRRREVDRLLTAARAALRSRDWNAARSSLEDILSREASHAEARTLFTHAIRREVPAMAPPAPPGPRATPRAPAEDSRDGATVPISRLVQSVAKPAAAERASTRAPLPRGPAVPSPAPPHAVAVAPPPEKRKPWFLRGRSKRDD